jgi:hypothetical protein
MELNVAYVVFLGYRDLNSERLAVMQKEADTDLQKYRQQLGNV